jgi:hypothetical protein
MKLTEQDSDSDLSPIESSRWSPTVQQDEINFADYLESEMSSWDSEQEDPHKDAQQVRLILR